jgi:hypothetical protein
MSFFLDTSALAPKYRNSVTQWCGAISQNGILSYTTVKIFDLATVIKFFNTWSVLLQVLTNQVLHGVESSASSFKFQRLLVSPKSSSSCFRLIPRLLLPSIFPSMMCFRRQFVRKIWPIHLAHLHIIVCRMFLSFLTSYSCLHGLYFHEPEPIQIYGRLNYETTGCTTVFAIQESLHQCLLNGVLLGCQ